MVTLKEQVDIKVPYKRMEAWANNFQEEFVRWSPYHTECEMYDGGYQKGMKVRFRENMILDNKYLNDILTEGKYPERLTGIDG